MGGYQGKSVESGTSNRLSDQAVGSEETGANCETSSDSNRSIWFKLRDWKSVSHFDISACAEMRPPLPIKQIKMQIMHYSPPA